MRTMRFVIGLVALQVFVVHHVDSIDIKGYTFSNVTGRMEEFVIQLAREVERLYENRCNISEFEKCAGKSYDHCSTRLYNQECPGGGLDHPFKVEYHFPQCGPLGGDCSALYDFTTSSLLYFGEQVDENLNFKNPVLTETTCYSSNLDKMFVARMKEDKELWDSLGVGPRWNFFGTPQSLFRMYPARNSFTCQTFDPRTRSWYNVGSNGPRNIVIILDMSESMLQENRLATAKAAVQRVLLTLMFRDRLTVVPFGSEAAALVDTSTFMYPGTVKKSRVVQDQVSGMNVMPGVANYTAAFEKAFEVFEKSADEGYAVNCHGAILFFTDGDTPQTSPDKSIDWIVQKTEQMEQKIGHALAMFTYSTTTAAFDSQVHTFQKDLACRSKIGIWSQIESPADVVDALWAYHNLFAMQLSDHPDTASWTEPYSLVALGYLTSAVSAPAYGRNVEPPIFLGVVSVPIAFAALNTALEVYGQGSERATTIEQFIYNKKQTCPKMKATPCLIESLQLRASGGRPICSNRTGCGETGPIQVEVETCPGMEGHYPDVWANRENQGIPYHDRACCLVGEREPSEECPREEEIEEEGDDTQWGLIAAVVGGVLVAGGALATLVVLIRRHEKAQLEEAEREKEERRAARKARLNKRSG